MNSSSLSASFSRFNFGQFPANCGFWLDVSTKVLDGPLTSSESSNSNYQVVAIVTQPPSARNRGRKVLPSPVVQFALDRGFPPDLIFTPERAGEGHDGVDLEMSMNGISSSWEDEFSDVDFTKNQLKHEKGEHINAQREKEIQQVAHSVHELAQVMKDLSVLVIDQGTIVDRIDHNIQNVATSVEQGFKNLICKWLYRFSLLNIFC